MNKFLVFPYDYNLKKTIEWSAKIIDGVVEDILSMEGWGETQSVIQFGKKQIRIKESINEISSNCNSVWIVESYYKVDFMTNILPILIYAKEKNWFVFYGRKISEKEEGIIKELIPKERLYIATCQYRETCYEDKLYDIKIPIVWIVDMFSRMQSQDVSIKLYQIFCELGYSTSLVSRRKDISLFKDIELFPEITAINCHDSIKFLNHYFKELERVKKDDLILVEIPGNLLEVSRKVYGDYGGMAYLMSKAVPPDVIICNIPYMDNILEMKEELMLAISSMEGLDIDYVNIIPAYLDVMESEQMKNFEYLTLSNDYINRKIENITHIYNVNSVERAQKLAEQVISQLNSYV